jgi:hypothetical protein
MDIDEPGWPLIDDFFEGLAQGRKAETVRRYVRVRHRFYDYLDLDDMTQWLRPADATLLAAEREFCREGAFWTVLGTEALLQCLPGFVAVDVLPSGTAEARMQVSVVGRLLKHLRHLRLVDRTMTRPYNVATRAVGRANLVLTYPDRMVPATLQAAYDRIDAAHPYHPEPER